MSTCDYEGCDHDMRFRVYASYDPAPMFRACDRHLGPLMLRDADGFGSTRQWLVVLPREATA